jgi:hypothetical protein
MGSGAGASTRDAVWEIGMHLIDNIPAPSLDAWYRWLTFLAIGLPILGAVLGGFCGIASFMVSSRISDLQSTALKHAEETAAEARELARSRSLSPDQTAMMLAVARQLCPTIKQVPVTAANGNQEAQAYALDFVNLFKAAGCESDLELPIPGLTPDVQGVKIGVRDWNAKPVELGLIEKIFAAGGISYQVNPLTAEFFAGRPFVLVIGAKPAQANALD